MLSTRQWTCAGCGTLHDRDENAAINILNAPTLELKVYPFLGMATLRAKQHAAYGLWSFARALDGRGQGRLEASRLYQEARNYGISPALYRRMLAEGLQNGMFNRVIRHCDGVEVIEIRSIVNVAASFDVPYLGVAPVLVPVEKLRKLSDWKAALWAAFHAGRTRHTETPHPVSRAALEAISGLPRRTQKTYEDRTGVKQYRNIAKSDVPATPEMLAGMAEVHPGAFAVYDADTQKRLVAWQLGNSYSSPYNRARHGALKRIHEKLKGRCASSAQVGRGKQAWTEKCYLDNPGSAERFMRRLERTRSYCYLRSGYKSPGKGLTVWTVYS